MSDAAGARSKQLEAILDVARSAVAAFDTSGRLIHSNLAEQQVYGRHDGERGLGQSAEEYLAHNRWFTMQNVEIPVIDLPIFRALRGEEVFEERLIVERNSGGFRYILQNARPLMIDGEFSGAAMLSLDLTELREAPDTTYTSHLENAVHRSRMIADIVMEINDNTSALDVDQMTDFAIARIAREFNAESGVLWLLEHDDQLKVHATFEMDRTRLDPKGYPLREFIFAREAMDRNQPVVVDSRDLKAPEAVVASMGKAESVLVIPLRIRGDRIGIAYLCIAKSYVMNQSDRLFASVWGRQCAQGIEVALLFDEIEVANERLIRVVEQLPQAVVLIDPVQEKVRIANSVAEQLFDREITDATSVHELQMHNADNVPLRGAQHPLLRVIYGGGRITGEVLLIPQKDGTVREVVATHVASRDPRGQLFGGISVLQDRADFATMDRTREEFLSVVAHEIRNPLTSLRGNLQLLERRIKRADTQDEQAEDYLHRIEIAIDEADRIGDVVKRVLDVSRAGLGRLDIQPEPMDAAHLVRDIAAAAQAREPGRKVSCIVPESVPVEWDADRMYQVLGNLTQNADRYAPGTPLEIVLECVENDQVHISVRDHGPGVAPAIRRRLFRQYYRFDDGSTDSMTLMVDGSRGLGIGLFVSARLVKQHGGRLRVQDAHGGGAEFVVTMPTIATAAVQRTNVTQPSG